MLSSKPRNRIMNSLLFSLPDDIVCGNVFPNLNLEDIVKLDSATINWRLREELHTKLKEIQFEEDKHELCSAGLKWIASRHMKFRTLNLDPFI